MHLSFWRRFFAFFIIIFFSLALFSPVFSVFFNADDFYNMRLVMNQSLAEVATSFLFKRDQLFLFYRPLTTQLYFFLTKPLFNFSPTGYHLISAAVFSLVLFLVYLISYQISRQQLIALLTLFFYGLSPSHLLRLGWIVQIQELSLALFVFGCIYFYFIYLHTRKRVSLWLSILSFILALMSKESAVIIPLLVILVGRIIGKSQKKISFSGNFLPFIFVLIIYLYFRFTKIGISTGVHYFTSWSIQSIFNTFFWYLLWAVGFPEYLVGHEIFTQSGRINPLLIHELVNAIPTVTFTFISFLGIIFIQSITIFLRLSKTKEINSRYHVFSLYLFAIGWFIISLIPHLFSPWHKFSYQLTVPLFGISFALAMLFPLFLTTLPLTRLMLLFAMIVYSIMSQATVKVEQETNWIFKRGLIAEKVFTFMKNNYQQLPQNAIIFFANDRKIDNDPFGRSHQISLALSDDAALQLLHNNPQLEVFYEDEDRRPPSDKPIITLSSGLFLPD